MLHCPVKANSKNSFKLQGVQSQEHSPEESYSHFLHCGFNVESGTQGRSLQFCHLVSRDLDVQ